MWKNKPLLKKELNSFTKCEVMLVAEEVPAPLVFQDNPKDSCCITKGSSHTEALQLILCPLETRWLKHTPVSALGSLPKQGAGGCLAEDR